MALTITAFLGPADETSLIRFVNERGFLVSPNQVPKDVSYVELIEALPMGNWPEGGTFDGMPRYCIFPNNWDSHISKTPSTHFDIILDFESEIISFERMRIWEKTMVYGTFYWKQGREREELVELWRVIKTWLRRNAIKLKKGAWLAKDAQRIAAQDNYQLMGLKLYYSVKKTEQGYVVQDQPIVSSVTTRRSIKAGGTGSPSSRS
ncbi:MAG: hypothetical protein HS116_23125 [Planctomycetes bacterium]|nr:hypothetical protein [Planctomycetota bacterium]